MTDERAEEWIGYLYKRGDLATATIYSYKGSMRTRWSMSGGTAINPWDSERVKRMLKGIANLRRTTEVARKAAHPKSIALTPARIDRISAFIDFNDPAHVMRYAAITLGTAAMLRPGEIFGSTSNRRPLHISDISFFATASPGSITPLLPPGSAISTHAVPDHYTINLGGTKADQFGTNAPSIVSSATSVRALWVWVHLRRDALTTSPILFIHQGVPVTTNSIVAYLTRLLTQSGVVNPRVTGRTFRRGGASHLVAHGVPRADIAAMGRWKTHAMIEVYADTESKEQRVVQAGRGLGPR